jgi:hypothetical protein
MASTPIELEECDVMLAGSGLEAAAKFRADPPDQVKINLNTLIVVTRWEMRQS